MGNRGRDVWRVLNMPCRGQAELMSKALDGQLSAEIRLAHRIHALTCRRCGRLWGQLSLLKHAAQGITSNQTHEAVSVRMPESVRIRLNERFGS